MRLLVADICRTLSSGECSQGIISRYSVIRFDLLESCYGGYENTLTAINSNAGSEYDINEVRYVKSDKEYRELIRYVREHGFNHAGDVITLSDDEKFDLYGNLSRCTSANRMQIGKFLHLRVEDLSHLEPINLLMDRSLLYTPKIPQLRAMI